MSTLPMTQPSNPNQAAGAALSPMTSTATGGVMGATVPQLGQIRNTGITGTPGVTAGQPFGVPPSPIGTVPTSGVGAPSISSGLNIADGEKTLTGDFKDTYGAGTGTAITGVLSNLGTAENSAYKATEANVLGSANRQYADVLAREAAHGISPDSSAHALAESDFMSQVNTNLLNTSANMQLGGLDTILSTLTGEGAAHGSDVGGWETFGNVLNAGAGLVGTAVGAATGINKLGGMSGVLKSIGIGK